MASGLPLFATVDDGVKCLGQLVQFGPRLHSCPGGVEAFGEPFVEGGRRGRAPLVACPAAARAWPTRYLNEAQAEGYASSEAECPVLWYDNARAATRRNP